MTTHQVSFETALGRCGIRWSERGITAVLLPGSRDLPPTHADDVAGLPPFVLRAIAGMTAVLEGADDDLRDIPIDHRDADAFRVAVYTATRAIAPGSTRSYGEIATAMGLGRAGGARDVGAALARNPTPIIVPCHRVVAASGALHGFSAPGGLETKRRMLQLEGAPGY
ncbi:MAG TPA: methylated-DNA--[protein]-cysteine S-methyltransferase, partial [Dongiaceae bacterium]|nr:methylated-DNA--[protein]-cysteine S-methyltransferase [Dongiaceae bacterium]